MDLNIPPSAEEFLQLDEFLRSDQVPAGTLWIYEVDGLFASVACGPGSISPCEWLPVIWNGHDQVFASTEEARTMTGILMRFYRETANAIMEGVDFAPMIYGGGDDPAADIRQAQGWCFGFMEGTLLRPTLWDQRPGSELTKIMMPVFALDAGDPPGLLGELLDMPGVREMFINKIPDAVYAINEYWVINGPGPVEFASARAEFKPRRTESPEASNPSPEEARVTQPKESNSKETIH